jgi:nitrous oxidase accessory protein NosD
MRATPSCFSAAFVLSVLDLAAPAQITIPVRAATDAALRAAFTEANTYAFRTSPSNPVIIRLDAALIGQTIRLANALPLLAVDHVVLEVAGAGPNDRVVLDTFLAPGSLRMTSHDAVVRNLTFRDAGRSQSVVGDGVIVSGAADFSFQYCTFERNYGVGLLIEGCQRFAIRDCTFDGNRLPGLGCDIGIRDAEVSGCVFRNHTSDTGIALTSGERFVVRDCVFENNRTGMIAGPITRSLTFGPANVVRTSGGAGLVIVAGFDAYVHGSRFENNRSVGISVEDAALRPRLEDNVLLGNGIDNAQTQLLLRDVLGAVCAGNIVQGGRGVGVLLDQCVGVLLTSTSANTGSITGQQEGAVIATSCSSVVLRGLDIRGNFVSGAGGAQVQFVDSSACLVEASTLVGGAGQLGSAWCAWTGPRSATARLCKITATSPSWRTTRATSWWASGPASRPPE